MAFRWLFFIVWWLLWDVLGEAEMRAMVEWKTRDVEVDSGMRDNAFLLLRRFGRRSCSLSFAVFSFIFYSVRFVLCCARLIVLIN